MSKASTHKQALRAGRWFSGLDDEFQDQLLDGADVVACVDGQTVFRRGDPAGGLYAVVRGAVVITAFTEGGKELVLTRLEPPSWLGEIAVFDRQERTHDVVADGEALLVLVPLVTLDALFANDPRRWRDVGLLAAWRLRLTFQTLEEASSLPLARRLVRRLLVLAESHGDRREHKRRVLSVRQEQLASMLASSRQSVNQVLQELQSRGLIKVAYGTVEILDFDALAAAT